LLRNLLSSNKLTKSGRGNEAKFHAVIW
jgi:hypothetical protein